MTFSRWDKLAPSEQALYMGLEQAISDEIQSVRDQLSDHRNDKGEPQSLLTPEAMVALKLAEMGL